VNSADELDKAITDFLADMGHEKCTPRSGCPVATLREEQRRINQTAATSTVPVPSTGTNSAPTTTSIESDSALNTSTLT
jgi:hypothetical protein